MTKANLKIFKKHQSAFFSANKFLFMFIVFLCVFIFKAPAFSQSTITVVGRGTTKEEALQDALRSAVEKATGVFVYSVTDVENMKVVQDKIVAQSKGYIKDYQIVEEKSFDGLIILTIDATVDEKAIESIIRDNIKVVTYDDVIKDYSLITQKIDRLKKSAELLKTIASRPITERYSFEFVGYKIGDIGLNQIRGQLLFKIILNPFYWKTYDKILQQISDPREKEKLCGGFIELFNYPQNQSSHAFVSKQAKIHTDLMEFRVQPQGTGISFYIPGEKGIEIAKYVGKLFGNWIEIPGEEPWREIRNIYEIGDAKDYCSYSKYDENGEFDVSFDVNGFCFEGKIQDKDDFDVCVYEYGFGLNIIFKNEITFAVGFSISDPETVKKFNRIKVHAESHPDPDD